MLCPPTAERPDRLAEAKRAKEATDKILQLPGASKPCEVMLAKNQGMYGQVGRGCNLSKAYTNAPNRFAFGPKINDSGMSQYHLPFRWSCFVLFCAVKKKL